MKRIYPLMFVVFTAIWVAGVVTAGASASTFWSVPSLLIVILIALALSLCTFSPAEIVHYYAIAFRSGKVDERELQEGLVYFRSLQWYLIAAGLIGLLIGMITILANVHSAKAIATGAAIALLTLFYGLVLAAGVAVPFRAGIERKIRTLAPGSER